MRKILSMLLALCLVFTVAPVSAMAEEPPAAIDSGEESTGFAARAEEDATAYNIWVGGVRVTDANKNDVLGITDGDGATITYDSDSNILTLNGANINTPHTVSAARYGIYAQADLKLKLVGTNAITLGPGDTAYGICTQDSDLQINAEEHGSLTVTTDGNFGIYSKNLTINSGEITTVKAVIRGNDSVSIRGGTVTSTGGMSGIVAPTLTVSGATVTASGSTYALNLTNAPDFTGMQVTASTEEGGSPVVEYEAAKLSTYKYLKFEPAPASTNVAQIGTTGYPTLQAAFDAAVNGQIIELIADITVEGVPETETDPVAKLSTAKGITLDLKGHKISRLINNTAFAIYVEKTGAELTIKDSIGGGEIYSKISAACCKDSAQLIIENVKIRSESSFFETIWVTTNGALTLKGGTIEATNGAPAIACNDGGLIFIKDGPTVIKSGYQTMNKAPNLNYFANVQITASKTKTDGTEASVITRAAIDTDAKVATYKYLKFETDTTAPTITGVTTLTVDGNYTVSDTLRFQVAFNETVVVGIGGGTPQLSLTIGSQTKQAVFVSGNSTSALTFAYTVQAGDIDYDGITAGLLTLNGGTICDAAGNNANLTLNNIADMSGIKLVPALTGTVTVSGTLKYSQTLTATYSAGNNTGTLSYQWKRGASDISGATANTYTLAQADIGQTLTCVVTSNVQAGFVSSDLTAAIAKADGPAAPAGLAGVAPTTERGSDGKITGTTTAMEYSLNTSFSPASPCTDSVTDQFDGGTTWYVRYQETATHEAGAYATVNIPVYASNALTGTATISNTAPRIGDRLTGSLVGGNNTGILSYVWKAGGTQVGIGSEYTVAAADIGKTIALEITSSVETGTRTSTATAAVAKKTAPAAPAAPTLVLKTHNSVTLTAILGYEFSKDGSTWQASNVFGSLAASTAYQFYQRVAATADTEASTASAGLSMTTNSNGGSGSSDSPRESSTSYTTGVVASGNLYSSIDVLVLTPRSTGTANEVVDSTTYSQLRQTVESGYTPVAAFEVRASSYSGRLTLSFPVGGQYNGMAFVVKHKTSDGTIHTYTGTVENGKAVVTVNSLSPFMVAIKGANKNPNTGR